jgi:protein SCO1/2
MNRKILRFVIIALAAGLGLALSAQWFNPKRSASPPPLETVKLLPKPRALPAFTLDSAAGPMTVQSLSSHWTVIFIGFSHCPDICPTTLTELARAQSLWRDSGLGNKPRLLFVSIDPERDSPKILADYAAYYDKDTLTATASEPQLSAFTRAIGLVYMKVPQGDSYTMDHSATLVVLNPKGEFAGIIRPPLKPDAIARDLLTLTKHMP